MSCHRRTRTKSYTHSQQSPGPQSNVIFTSTTPPCSRTTVSYYPSAATPAAPTIRKRTFSAQKQPRKRASSATAASLPTNRPFLFIPSTPPIVGPRNATTTALGPPPPYTPFAPLTTKSRSRSSSHISQNISTASFLAQYTPSRMRFTQGASSDSESEPDPLDEDDEGGIIYTAKQQQQPGYGATFRSRIFLRHSKGITTAPGQLGAGETETEADEPVRTRSAYHVPDRNFDPFHHPAKTFTYCADSTGLRSSGTAKFPRASHHTTLVRGFPSTLHRTSSIWSAVQLVQGMACSHEWKKRSHNLRYICLMGTSF
jgi:hypothetical protein